MLDTALRSGKHGVGVAHASPPQTDPSAVSCGGKGTSRLGLPSCSSVSGTSLGGPVRDVEGPMTAKRNFKRNVGARATKTGESYTAALRHLRPSPRGENEMQTTRTMRLAVVQSILRQDPRRGDELRESGRDIRRFMQQAHDEGARLVHFPEGMTCSPHKLALSVDGPEKVGPSDWDRFPWTTLQEELAATAALAGELGLWIALGLGAPTDVA